jgi:hypothetical protein
MHQNVGVLVVNKLQAVHLHGGASAVRYGPDFEFRLELGSPLSPAHKYFFFAPAVLGHHDTAEIWCVGTI